MTMPNPKGARNGEAQKLGIAKLATSGLTLEDALKLGITFLEAEQVRKLHSSFKALPAMRFSYRDPHEPTKPLSAWPGWPPFYRLRYLKDPNDFTKITEGGGKKFRYVQEPESGLCAYFPSIVDWPKLLNSDGPLIITEGELKAAKATREGFPTIGLGGVSSYKSGAMGVKFLRELAAINWVKRYVYIIYDSDYRTNEQVCKALNALAEELMTRGALPHVVPLPDVVDEGKTGLDDFLVHSKGLDLRDLIHDRAQPLTLARNLFKLNEQAVYVRNPGLIVLQEDGQKLSPSSFTEHAYSTHDHAEQVVRADGGISLKSVSAAAAWLKWPLRREVQTLTYDPGEPPLIIQPGGKTAWNTWPGWGCEPKKGDVTPFTKLIDHLFTDTDPEAKRWFMRWLAYPIQAPGTKLFTSAVVYGVEHGTGKSLVGYTMKRIYGKNFAEIKQADLHANHNEWAENKQFVLADDITGSTKRQDADLLKKLITQQEMRLNIKYIPSYAVPDVINYYFTSNQPDAFFLEDNDRRFFIHEVAVAPMGENFYKDYISWLRDDEGAAKVFHHLLKLDMGDFNPAAPALKTRAKETMIQDVKSDLGSWVHQLKVDPAHILKLGDMAIPGDLMTSKQLLALYDPIQRTGTTANGLARELRRAGVPQFRRGIPLHTSDGQARYYIVRNREKWLTATPADAIKHIEGLLGKGSAKASKF